MSQPLPAFGKRNAARAPSRPSPPAAVDHAAFFAAVRAEFDAPAEARGYVVPRSFKAAFLAGLVVGCAFAGFDVTGPAGADRFDAVAGALGLQIDTSALVPALILLGLFGGARVAATTIILVHGLLDKAGWTHHAAYAIGGALASACFAAGMMILVGEPPAHGWAVELAAGAGAGFFYRVFAGRRPA